jgi:hypothetical protein
MVDAQNPAEMTPSLPLPRICPYATSRPQSALVLERYPRDRP